MTDLRDNLDAALALVDGTGVRLLGLNGRPDGSVLIAVRDCDSYRRLAAAIGSKADGGRLHQHPLRHYYDATAGDILVEHLCWPHLDCWPTDPRKDPR